MKQSDKLKELLEEIRELAEKTVLYLPVIESLEHEEEKEPLIKDEKIRKAVRTWAEALDTESCSFRADHDIFDFIGCGANYLRFDMSDGFDTYKLEDIPNGYYHIAELCGEEE